MNIYELVDKKAVSVSLQSVDKKNVIIELVDMLEKSGSVKKKEKNEILKKIQERENLGSTGIGKGVAIPHAKCACVKKLVASFGISQTGIDFKSLDGEKTHIFFLLIAPGDNPGPHLKALAKISRLLDDKFIRERFLSSKNPQEILKIIKEEEQKQNK